MKILLNYADGKFLESQSKNSQSGLASGFNVVYQMSRSEISSMFIEQNKEIMSSSRGAGYWLWKSYFINRILKGMCESDILFYADAGSVFLRSMEPIFNAVMTDSRGIIGFHMSGKHLERHHTKRDIFRHMNVDIPEVRDTPQRMASFMCFRGTEEAKSIVSEYMSLCCNIHLITDSPNSDGWLEPDFIDNRHDQSIWSVLTKKYRITILPDPTQWGIYHDETKSEDQYIFHSRDPR